MHVLRMMASRQSVCTTQIEHVAPSYARQPSVCMAWFAAHLHYQVTPCYRRATCYRGLLTSTERSCGTQRVATGLLAVWKVISHVDLHICQTTSYGSCEAQLCKRRWRINRCYTSHVAPVTRRATSSFSHSRPKLPTHPQTNMA